MEPVPSSHVVYSFPIALYDLHRQAVMWLQSGSCQIRQDTKAILCHMLKKLNLTLMCLCVCEHRIFKLGMIVQFSSHKFTKFDICSLNIFVGRFNYSIHCFDTSIDGWGGSYDKLLSVVFSLYHHFFVPVSTLPPLQYVFSHIVSALFFVSV